MMIAANLKPFFGGKGERKPWERGWIAACTMSNQSFEHFRNPQIQALTLASNRM